ARQARQRIGQPRIVGVGHFGDPRPRRADRDRARGSGAAHAQRQQAGHAFLHQMPVDGLREAGLEHGVRGADAGMAGEGHLALRTEHAQCVAGIGRGRREHERGLGQPRPARDRLHGGIVQAFGVQDHGQWIAHPGAVGEDIELQVASGHGERGGRRGAQLSKPRRMHCRGMPAPRRPRLAIRLESALRPHAGRSRPFRWTCHFMPSSPIGTPWVVLKFGGTSVSQRHRWDTIGQLAGKRAEECGGRVLVVVSALSGVTNELTAIAGGADDAGARVDALVERHRAFARELGLEPDAVLGGRLAALRALLDDARAPGRRLDWQAEVLAPGDLLSSTLGVAYLRAQGLDFGWTDARDWLDAIELPNQSDWGRRLSASCRREADDDWRARFAAQPSRLLLTQGFIARHPGGGTAVLGRGGSATSAALFGGLLRARRVEIWTDVPGMFTANPREVPDARLLTRLDYAEAQEIATTGAKVLHPRSLGPCRVSGVPMAILDTTRPELPGTRIDADAAHVPGVKAISRRNGIVLVSMETVGMWQSVGFLADIFERFR